MLAVDAESGRYVSHEIRGDVQILGGRTGDIGADYFVAFDTNLDRIRQVGSIIDDAAIHASDRTDALALGLDPDSSCLRGSETHSA